MKFNVNFKLNYIEDNYFCTLLYWPSNFSLENTTIKIELNRNFITILNLNFKTYNYCFSSIINSEGLRYF